MTPSRIHRLSLTHFRNYRAATIAARGDVVALVGPNGAGKTNCLEAISFLSPGRGLRRATLEDVADNQGDGSWAVSAEVEGALGLATLGTGIDAPQGEANGTTRRCRIDREPVGSATAFGDHLRMVWLTPAMDGLFMGAASERRRFFDRLVLAIDSEHSSRVSALERSLRSRNRLLEVRNYDDHWCDAIERETAELAVAVAAFNLVAGTAVATGASDDSGSGRVWGSGVMLVGCAAIVWGLSIRRNRERWGNTLIAVGALPALLWFWYLVPAIAAIAVIAGSTIENHRLRHPRAAPQLG